MSRWSERSLLFASLALIALIIAAAVDLPTLAGLGVFAEQALALAVGLSLFIVFSGTIADPRTSGTLRAINGSLALASLLTFGCVGLYYPELLQLAVSPPIWLVVMATTMLVLLGEATRRTAGLAMAVLVLVFFCYCVFGQLLPASWGARTLKTERVIVYLIFDTNALFSQTLAIGVVVVGPFILFGEVLNGSGAGTFFTRFGQLIFGRQRGGAAKAAVIGSALFGTVSGSAVANVATVGVVTIPMMKSAGYPASVAAAIEAVGSTGGQLMPPVMGASAFLMAEYLQIPYSSIVAAAIVPASLYFLALFLHIDLMAGRLKLAAGAWHLDSEGFLRCIRDGWIFFAPFAFLVVALTQFNWRPENAAVAATSILLILARLVGYRSRRMKVADVLPILQKASQGIVGIVIVTAAAGLIIGCLNLSGLSFIATERLLGLVNGSLPLLLVVTALAAIILGMPLPTTGVYIILVPLMAPALVALGISPLQAHFFIMYFGVMSMITPPIALSALVAANIAESGFWRTGFEAMRIGWTGYIVPFGIALSPAFLLIGDAQVVALTLIKSVIGLGLLSIASAGFAIRPVGSAGRITVAAAGIVLFLPASTIPLGTPVHAIAFLAGIGLVANQWLGISRKTAKSR